MKRTRIISVLRLIPDGQAGYRRRCLSIIRRTTDGFLTGSLQSRRWSWRLKKCSANRATYRAGFLYSDGFAGQRFIDRGLQVVASDGRGIAGAIVDSAVVHQDTVLIEQIAFRRAACAKGPREGGVVIERVIPL